MAAFDASATLAGNQPASAGAGGGGQAAGRVAIEIQPTFCPVEAESPFDTTEWELRTAAIKGEDGKATVVRAALKPARFLNQAGIAGAAMWATEAR